MEEDDEEKRTMRNIMFRPTPRLVMLGTSLNLEINSLKEFIEETDLHIKDNRTRIEDMAKEGKAKYKDDPDALNEMYDFLEDDYNKYKTVFVKIHLNTAFVSSVSLFEYFLKRICYTYYKEFKLKVDDIKADGNVSAYRKYLEKVVELDLSSLDEKWNTLLKYNQVRNSIVHEYSDAWKKKDKPLDQQPVYQFISRSPHIKIERPEYGRFYIQDKQFILDFLGVAHEYLKGVIAIGLK